MMKSLAQIQLLLKLLSSTSNTLQKASKYVSRCGQSSIFLYDTALCVKLNEGDEVFSPIVCLELLPFVFFT